MNDPSWPKPLSMSLCRTVRQIAFLTLLVAGSAWGASLPVPGDLVELRKLLIQHISRPEFEHARWGVLVESLDTDTRLFAHDADRLFIPASNTKLYTGALALDRLGPDFRSRTSLYTTSPPNRRGTVKGDLIVRGGGDPSLGVGIGDADQTLTSVLAPFVDAVVAAGVRRVKGDLVADESYFRAYPFGAGWEWDDFQHRYAAEVSALSLLENTLILRIQPGEFQGVRAEARLDPPLPVLSLRNHVTTAGPDETKAIRTYRAPGSREIWLTGTIPLHDPEHRESLALPRPALAFGLALKEALADRRVRVDGDATAVDFLTRDVHPIDPKGLFAIGEVPSPPLRDILPEMMKSSRNLYAQALLLQVGTKEFESNLGSGSRRPQPHSIDAERAGLLALESLLSRAGVQPGEVLLEEGSGLTRRNLVTPQATVRLLRFMHNHPDAALFRHSLPVASRDGTLRQRMQDTVAADNAQAKTGYLRHTYVLSGYVSTAAGERLVFSLMLNNFRNPDPEARGSAWLDDIVVMLASLDWRSTRNGERKGP